MSSVSRTLRDTAAFRCLAGTECEWENQTTMRPSRMLGPGSERVLSGVPGAGAEEVGRQDSFVGACARLWPPLAKDKLGLSVGASALR